MRKIPLYTDSESLINRGDSHNTGMTTLRILTVFLLSILTLGGANAANVLVRDHITIVGSSTAFPIVSTVAERFKRTSRAPSPVVISMGTGGGFKLFCSDKGTETPDITMASRKLKPSERKLCSEYGIKDITEIKIGYDGIAFASAKQSRPFQFRTKDLYLALAREVPSPDGQQKLVTNPYERWSQINHLLPDIPIRVLGPPPTSGTRDILVEKLIDQACQEYTYLQKMKNSDIDQYRNRCYTFREDGAYINAGENDARIVRKLIDDPKTIGIIGYNFLERNRDLLKAATIDTISPDYEQIEDGTYLLTRPLYIYVNQKRVEYIPNLYEFLLEFTSDSSWGEEGYLADQGLISLTSKERQNERCHVVTMRARDIADCDHMIEATQ